MNKPGLIRALAVAGACITALPALAAGPSEASARMSQDLSNAVGTVVVLGALSTIAVSVLATTRSTPTAPARAARPTAATATVTAVERDGDSVTLLLRGIANGAEVSLRFAAAAFGTSALAVGSSVTVVGEASGHAIHSLGRLVAFVPNETGRSLVHHAVYPAAGGSQ